MVNSLTAKCVPVGTKNSLSEDFLLSKHTSHKHPHHDEPFSPLASWFPWMHIPHPRSLFERGWTRPPSKGLVKNCKVNEKLFYFYPLSVNYNNRSPTVGNDSQNGIHCCRRTGSHPSCSSLLHFYLFLVHFYSVVDSIQFRC